MLGPNISVDDPKRTLASPAEALREGGRISPAASRRSPLSSPLILAQQLCCRASARLLLEIDLGQLAAAQLSGQIRRLWSRSHKWGR